VVACESDASPSRAPEIPYMYRVLTAPRLVCLQRPTVTTNTFEILVHGENPSPGTSIHELIPFITQRSSYYPAKHLMASHTLRWHHAKEHKVAPQQLTA
jgi:N-acyl-L-homoserine lactone synthetase